MGWVGGSMEKAAAGTLESPAFLQAGSAVPGGPSQDCLPPAAGACKPMPREQLPTVWLGNLLLLHPQAHSPFLPSAVSARCPTSEQGSRLSSQAEQRSLEGPHPWSQRAGTQGQSEKARGATAISFRGMVAWPHSLSLLGPPVLSIEANCSLSPSKEPTKGNGLLQHVRLRIDLRKSLASQTRGKRQSACLFLGALGSGRQDQVEVESAGSQAAQVQILVLPLPS